MFAVINIVRIVTARVYKATDWHKATRYIYACALETEETAGIYFYYLFV